MIVRTSTNHTVRFASIVINVDASAPVFPQTIYLMKTKILYKVDAERLNIHRFPNFHRTGSIAGMKKLYYGKDALLVRCGSYIYNVSSEPDIYHNEAH